MSGLLGDMLHWPFFLGMRTADRQQFLNFCDFENGTDAMTTMMSDDCTAADGAAPASALQQHGKTALPCRTRTLWIMRLLFVVAVATFTLLFLLTPYSSQTIDSRRRFLTTTNQNTAASAVGPISDAFQKAISGNDKFRVLYVVTTLSEYETGTRGTSHGADRLRNIVIPALQEAVQSFLQHNWHVDIYLILGYERLAPERLELIRKALPQNIRLEIWEDAMPLFYKKGSKRLSPASHGLSRQHRYVIRDKLQEYDFFACFEDDMRITADHVLNFLEMSAQLEQLQYQASNSKDGMVHVQGESHRDASKRSKPTDRAKVGNDVVDDPLTAAYLQRVIPGFVRVEVMNGNDLATTINSPPYSKEVPVSQQSFVNPDICCKEDEPGRGSMKPNPQPEDVVIWETNIGAAGVRKYPDPIGWVAAMPVEDRADVGSYWSGEGNVFEDKLKSRPRRLDATLGQQAGWMATHSQILNFHFEACPGGFLPPYDDAHWKGDSLQRHAVEFWSGGFQLFGQCFLNRILSLQNFSKQLLYHTANNKQHTKNPNGFTRAQDFLGQLYTVKERAERSIKTTTTRRKR